MALRPDLAIGLPFSENRSESHTMVSLKWSTDRSRTGCIGRIQKKPVVLRRGVKLNRRHSNKISGFGVRQVDPCCIDATLVCDPEPNDAIPTHPVCGTRIKRDAVPIVASK